MSEDVVATRAIVASGMVEAAAPEFATRNGMQARRPRADLGSGGPRGLSGPAIPLAGRGMAGGIDGMARLEDWLVAWGMAKLTTSGVRSILLDAGDVHVDAPTRRAVIELVERTFSGLAEAFAIEEMEIAATVAGAGRVLLLRIDVRAELSDPVGGGGDLADIVDPASFAGTELRGVLHAGGALIEAALFANAKP